MTDHAQSGADAAVSAPVPPASAPHTDETYDLRQQAARHLLNYLDRTDAMIARCEATMRDKGGDQFTAANTAARLMKVSTDVTKALMVAAFGETRHRSFRETVVSPPAPREPAAPNPIREDIDATTTVLARQLRLIAEESAQEWDEERAKHAKVIAEMKTYGQEPVSYVRPPQ
jgi:hypothetical protein